MKNQKISSLLMRKEAPSMATTRIMPLHIGKGRTESRAISDMIDYVANPQKTDNGKLITGAAAGVAALDGGVTEGVGRSTGPVFVSPIRAGRAIPKPKIVSFI